MPEELHQFISAQQREHPGLLGWDHVFF
jgi:hypothetical protein